MLQMEMGGDGEEDEGDGDAAVWDDGEDTDDLDGDEDDEDDIARREMGQKNNSLCPLRVFLIPLN